MIEYNFGLFLIALYIHDIAFVSFNFYKKKHFIIIYAIRVFSFG